MEIKISEMGYVSSQRNTTYKLHIVEQTGKKKSRTWRWGPGGGGRAGGGGGGQVGGGGGQVGGEVGGGGKHMKRWRPNKYKGSKHKL